MITIAPPDPAWPAEFAALARRLRGALSEQALRIDHIGSTSVPGLSAKDIVDVQVAVAALEPAAPFEAALAAAGFRVQPGIWHDHMPPGVAGPAENWAKRMVKEAAGERPANIHVRVLGRANQRYALLFRDYLRTHPGTAAAYAELKRRLAAHLETVAVYAEVKDPACDIIMDAAEAWAVQTGWAPGPSDA